MFCTHENVVNSLVLAILQCFNKMQMLLRKSYELTSNTRFYSKHTFTIDVQ